MRKQGNTCFAHILKMFLAFWLDLSPLQAPWQQDSKDMGLENVRTLRCF